MKNEQQQLSESKAIPQRIEEHEESTSVQIIRLAIVGLAAILSWIGIWRLFLPIDLIAIVAILAGGYPVYKETFKALKHGRINMEVSMAIAIFASLLVGQFTVSVVITLFVLLSEYIEGYAVDKGRQTIVLLEKSAPKKALVRRNGAEFEIETESLKLNDIVIVRDGDRIPVDGTVVIGSAYVNQSAITGESNRIEKKAGESVYAGSINESGVIEVRTEKIGSETVFGKIIKLVEEAENKKAPIQKISDRLANWLVEFAIGFSVLTFVLTRNLTSSLSVIVVAGACGVAAGTPLAIVAIMSKAAKKGAIVKAGAYVEEMNRIDTIVIDKTGTLTLGKPIVADIISFDDWTNRQVLEFAVAAERYSNHPVAKAITSKANEIGVSFSKNNSSHSSSSMNYLPGKGIVSDQEGQQIIVGNSALMTEMDVRFPRGYDAETISRKASNRNTTVLIAYAGRICGVISVSDGVRAESKKAIADLKEMKIQTVMLTGDNWAVAKEVAQQVGIDEVYAELLPGDKVSFIESLVAKGNRVAMVGDGINDAPALARANVGIGMGAGTDVAIEEADIVLMTNDLQKITEITKLSRKAYRTIMQNFYGTITVDGIGVTLAFLGFLNPFLAAGIHVLSELVFILNSARLIR